MDSEKRTVWCGNLSDKVTEELLYELFLQVAPLERVRIPTDKEGRKSNFGFVTLKHEVSVDYAVQLLNGTTLFDRSLNIKPRNTNQNQAQRFEPPTRFEQPSQARFELPQPFCNNQNVTNNLSDLFEMGQLLQLNFPRNDGHQRRNDYAGGGRQWDNNRDNFRNHSRYDRSNSGGKHHPYRDNHRNHGENRNRRRF